MAKRILSAEEIFGAMDREQEVRYTSGETYKGVIVKEIKGRGALPENRGPTFLFKGIGIGRKDASGDFKVVAGDLFIED